MAIQKGSLPKTLRKLFVETAINRYEYGSVPEEPWLEHIAELQNLR